MKRRSERNRKLRTERNKSKGKADIKDEKEKNKNSESFSERKPVQKPVIGSHRTNKSTEKS